MLLNNVPLITNGFTGGIEALLYSKVHDALNVRNTTAASLNLSNNYLTLAWIVAGSHTLWHSTYYKCLSDRV